jgi:hypothetical protein
MSTELNYCPACNLPADSFQHCGSPNCAVRDYGPGDACTRRRTAPVSAPLDTQALPPPECLGMHFSGGETVYGYSRATVEQIIAPYAERSRQLERELAEHKAARIAYANEFPPDAEGDPDVGSIHANIRSLKRDLADRRAAWISAKDLLPEGHCLATYMNSAGNRRTIIAFHATRFSVEAYGDDAYSEVNDENDLEYLREGWYECIDNWGDFSSVFVNEGQVTHWMPLPAAPTPMNSGKEEAK